MITLKINIGTYKDKKAIPNQKKPMNLIINFRIGIIYSDPSRYLVKTVFIDTVYSNLSTLELSL
jgi:hypothetical protein